MDQTVVLGGQTINWASYDFKGGKITSILGGMEIDLSECYLSNDDHSIFINIICGSVELIVSKDWNLKVEIKPILGVIEDDIRGMNSSYNDPARSLILKGSILMGSLSIIRA